VVWSNWFPHLSRLHDGVVGGTQYLNWPTVSIPRNGEYTFYKRRKTMMKRIWSISIQRAFEHPPNVAMAKLLDKNFGTQPHKFLRLCRSLKLSKPLGLKFPDKPIPKIHSGERRGGLSLPGGLWLWLEIIHCILDIIHAIANDGKMISRFCHGHFMAAGWWQREFETATINSKIARVNMNNWSALEAVLKMELPKNLKSADYG